MHGFVVVDEDDIARLQDNLVQTRIEGTAEGLEGVRRIVIVCTIRPSASLVSPATVPFRRSPGIRAFTDRATGKPRAPAGRVRVRDGSDASDRVASPDRAAVRPGLVGVISRWSRRPAAWRVSPVAALRVRRGT